jgi:predicted house-cleaning noncanonical NTP pyrophosphatase (MazG superfamily)
LEKSIEFIRDKFTKEINSNKFYFYIQIQEFEALLYSNINEIDNYFETNKLKELGDILNKVKNNLELINDSTETKPSKRLNNLFSNFGKTTDGIVILKNIGIDKIRNECA